MDKPHVAQKEPYAVEVEAGKKYLWCSCGLSKKQPFCDASHKGTPFKPLLHVAEESGTVYFCGCKHTKSPPMCDGSHNDL
ncbi:MAG: CDGSH iron-sulfur domain-containing protein [Rhodobacterales bacterium]|nr:CDGSH iron-sulfur domain-containing protein [Rhodobacterales bacterium]